MRWAEIVGADVADHAEPLKIQWPRGAEGDSREPGTLVLRVEGPAAIEIQHMSQVILERVNRYFGFARDRPDRDPAGAAAPSRRASPTGRWIRRQFNVLRTRCRITDEAPENGAGAARRRRQAKVTARSRSWSPARHCHICRGRVARFRDKPGSDRPPSRRSFQ